MFKADGHADETLADAGSLWVSVGRQTGAVTTTENLPSAAYTNWADPATYLRIARDAATGREQMGGR